MAALNAARISVVGLSVFPAVNAATFAVIRESLIGNGAKMILNSIFVCVLTLYGICT